MSTVKVHWLRHGEIASHRGDIPLTERGTVQSWERGRSLAEDVVPGETIHFMHAPTLRTRQTVEGVRASMEEILGGGVKLLEVGEQWAIRNPDIFIAGQRVEMVSSADALAEQLHAPPVDSKTLSEHSFFKPFFPSSDRIGYWLEHPDPPGENPVAVARRQMAFASSLLDGWDRSAARYVLSTHSPVLRAILAYCLGEDSGEPGYLEPVDLIFSSDKAPELRFRDHRKTLSGTTFGGGAPG